MASTEHLPAPHPLFELLSGEISDRELRRCLRVVRRHLGMDVAFLSRFRESDRVLDHVDGPPDGPIHEGQILPFADGYCMGVARGELPQLIPDTALLPAAQCIPATQEIPIGAHMSVPIQVGRRIYGTLCCFSFLPRPDLGERDIGMLRAFAEIFALRLHEVEAHKLERQAMIDEIDGALAAGAPRIVFQPVFALQGLRLHGFECLSRFDVVPQRGPAQWFQQAELAGVGIRLELHVLAKALAHLRRFPPQYRLSVNLSPELMTSAALAGVLGDDAEVARLTLEITEHAIVRNYQALAQALAPLRERGAQVAVDDAGAGYASMRHILQLQPDVIKLDMSITQCIHSDRSRRALAKGLTNFAHEIGTQVVAEGVETAQELEALRELQVDFVQGYFLSRPLHEDAALALGLKETG
ncbi:MULTISPECIES: sensor domain-containing phosphodiesterase [Xanthomonas]|uniref:sensor domain-containing phosphodiesterase n=1 Tax=Xanthomonas TaxID=338 RepID=UPI001AD97E14|nr:MULTISPECIES: EAL domain-containing protein [unclassified Xanthomonas]MBO9875364.1 EAL domain-containing protein [Xanthomonas sp. D-93]WNH45431.1 EAL domain-containing protein [Xanthomonas sp. A6251]